MSKLFVSSLRGPSTFAQGLCAMIATLGIAGLASAQCPNPNGGNCFTETPGEPGCINEECCDLVCTIEPTCCLDEWTEVNLCVTLAQENCEGFCDGSQTIFSNLVDDGGVVFAGVPGTTPTSLMADDLIPVAGGTLTEIEFSIGNFNLTGAPSSDVTALTLEVWLVAGTSSFVAPDLVNDVIAIFEVDLTELLDPGQGGDPLAPDTAGTIAIEPVDPVVIPPGLVWVGVAYQTATFTGTGTLSNLGQLLGVNPTDPGPGASANLIFIEGFGLAAFQGGVPYANLVFRLNTACGAGACCFAEDGSCEELEQADCEAQGGFFAGSGILCEDVVCNVLGACCLLGGTCVDDLFEAECEEDFGGTWQGGETNCPIACPPPCNQPCTGTAEGEACGQSTNGGCSGEVAEPFGAIACGQTVCGTAWADGGTRDTDWYEITIPAGPDMAVTVTLSAEFPADSFLLDANDCDNISFPDPDNNGVNVGADCTDGSYTVCIPPGTYAIFVGAATPAGGLFDGVPCGSGANDYRLSVSCTPCGVVACPQDCVTSATLQPPPDGIVDGADLAVLIGAWGNCPGCCSDTVTSATLQPPPDGVVDGADLAVLIGAWGNPGCQ